MGQGCPHQLQHRRVGDDGDDGDRDSDDIGDGDGGADDIGDDDDDDGGPSTQCEQPGCGVD